MQKLSLEDLVTYSRQQELLSELSKVHAVMIEFKKKGYHLLEGFDERIIGSMKELSDLIFDYGQKVNQENLDKQDAELAAKKVAADLVNAPTVE